MSPRPVDFVMGHAFEAMVNSALSRFGELPIPHDEPVVHAVGPDADRLLLMGTGAVRGLGTTSNDLGLGGQLARRLPPLTGRGVDLEMASTTTLMIHQASGLLDSYDTGRFDAIIMFIGMRDAVHLTSPADWRRDMRHLLEAASRVPQVFVVAIPDFTTYLDIPPYAKRAIRARIGRLNDEARRLCADIPGAEFVSFDPHHPDHFVRPGSIEVYEIFADALAPALADALDPLQSPRSAQTVTEKARQDALDALGVFDIGSHQRVDRIVHMARDLLGASGAAVVFLDRNRRWIESAVALSSHDIPRAETFCNATIATSRLFVVEDATKDPRFASHPWVVGDEHVKFYAGYPLEAPEGVRVGALCVVDTTPRRFSRAEASLLRDLALQVQAVLWSSARRRRVGDSPEASPAAHTLGE